MADFRFYNLQIETNCVNSIRFACRRRGVGGGGHGGEGGCPPPDPLSLSLQLRFIAEARFPPHAEGRRMYRVWGHGCHQTL